MLLHDTENMTVFQQLTLCHLPNDLIGSSLNITEEAGETLKDKYSNIQAADNLYYSSNLVN